MYVGSLGVLSTLSSGFGSGGGCLFGSGLLFLFFLLLGFVQLPLLLLLNGELKRSLFTKKTTVNTSSKFANMEHSLDKLDRNTYVMVSSSVVADAGVPPELIDSKGAYF